ncbi:MAG: hypothetical protein OER96_06505 [Gammaproteobacteria bacterium]|nr:hypothetical protein [Gammaproteobacteria bacterium]
MSEFNVHFNDGPVVTNVYPRRSLTARFSLHNNLEYEIKLQPDEWGKCYKRYCAPWRIEILNDRDKVLATHNFDPNNKKILINFDSRSLGDTLTWIPQVDQFAQQHPTARVLCCQFWSNLRFENTYPNIEFVPPDKQLDDIYATYTIGYFLGDDLENRHPNGPRQQPLTEVASDILSIDYAEQRPRLNVQNESCDIDDKYICFTTESTAACKLWQYPGGWQRVIDYLNTMRLRPVLIQKKINRNGEHY